MTTYELYSLIVLGFGALMLFGIASALEKANKNHYNIASRLLDLEILLRDRR